MAHVYSSSGSVVHCFDHNCKKKSWDGDHTDDAIIIETKAE